MVISDNLMLSNYKHVYSSLSPFLLSLLSRVQKETSLNNLKGKFQVVGMVDEERLHAIMKVG